MNRQELVNDVVIQDWFKTMDPSVSHADKCIAAMMYYTKFTNQTPAELKSKAESELKQGLLDFERELFKLIPRFENFLRNNEHLNIKEIDEYGNVSFFKYIKGDYYKVTTDKNDNQILIKRSNRRKLNDNAVAMYTSCVSSFYRYNGIRLPDNPKKRIKPSPIKENDDLPTLDEVRAVHVLCNKRDRALIVCGLSGGMGAAELSSLKVVDFDKNYFKKDVANRFPTEFKITKLKAQRSKTDKIYTTFISSEAAETVYEYLKERDASPERPGKFYQDRYIKRKATQDSYLFIQDHIDDSYIETENEELRKLTGMAIAERYRIFTRKANLNTGKNVYNKVRAHNMRHLFRNILEHKGCNSTMIDYWSGHELSGSRSSYFVNDDDEMLELYKKFEVYLTLHKRLSIQDNPLFIETEKRLKEAELENEKIKVERYEYAQRDEKIAQLEKRIADSVKIDVDLNEVTDRLIEKIQQGDVNAVKMFKKLQEVRKPAPQESYYDPLLEVDESGNTIND